MQGILWSDANKVQPSAPNPEGRHKPGCFEPMSNAEVNDDHTGTYVHKPTCPNPDCATNKPMLIWEKTRWDGVTWIELAATPQVLQKESEGVLDGVFSLDRVTYYCPSCSPLFKDTSERPHVRYWTRVEAVPFTCPNDNAWLFMKPLPADETGFQDFEYCCIECDRYFTRDEIEY